MLTPSQVVSNVKKLLHFSFKNHMARKKMTSFWTIYIATGPTSKGHGAILYVCLYDDYIESPGIFLLEQT